MVKIYVHTKFGWDISIHRWDKTTSGLGKRTVAILEFYLLCQFWHRCSHRHVISHQHAKFEVSSCIISTASELMKLIFAVLDVSSTMGLTRCYKTEGLLHLYLQFLYIFHAIFIRYTRLRRRKSICITNFNAISQSTADIKLLPVSIDGWPPYWNFISSFHFDL